MAISRHPEKPNKHSLEDISIILGNRTHPESAWKSAFTPQPGQEQGERGGGRGRELHPDKTTAVAGGKK
jgi:hypothetical protein